MQTCHKTKDKLPIGKATHLGRMLKSGQLT